MIVVATGTHHQPFDRLVAAAGRVAETGEAVFVQAGASALRPSGCEVVGFVTPEVLERRIAEARAVVCHAGPATILLAREHGHVPIVWPRDPRHGEHVDDHQLRFAARLGGIAHVVHDADALLDALKGGPDVLRPGPGNPTGVASPSFVEGFAALAEEVVTGRGPRDRPRGSLPAILARWGLGRR